MPLAPADTTDGVDGVSVAALQLAPPETTPSRETIREWGGRAAVAVERCVGETGAQLVVLPETAATGFVTGLDRDTLWDVVGDGPGAGAQALAEVAARLGTHVVLGCYARAEPPYVYNAAVVLGPGGVSATYRKTHVFSLEHAASGGWVVPGEEAVVADTGVGRIGLTICYDGDYPELARILTVAGAWIVVRPSAFLRSPAVWELTNRARAYDNHVFVVAANAVGRDAGGYVYFGNSMIVGPTGAVLASGTSQEQWVSATLDRRAFDAISPGSSLPQTFDHMADRNLELYRRHADALLAPARSPLAAADDPSGRGTAGQLGTTTVP